MRIKEIDQKLSDNNIKLKELQMQKYTLSKEIGSLLELKKNSEMKYFWDYIGNTYTFDRYVGFKGIPTGKGNEGVSPAFRQGDVIEIIKENKSSVIIKCTTKNITKKVGGVVEMELTHPNWTFRVDKDNFFHNIIRESGFMNGLKSYINRVESLEELGI